MRSSAALVVADSLGRNTSLLRLRLDHNPLGEKGGRRLMLALNKNETLEEITLLGAQLNQAGGVVRTTNRTQIRARLTFAVNAQTDRY
jgi:hypothetical protein